jgi:ATP adenylyltransferase/5',5'''-P-1,P-4-tetraphosphate phosphorylase II
MNTTKEPDGREHVGDEMLLTTSEGEEGTGITFLPSLPVQRKRKRRTKKQREEQSARPSAKQRGG